MIWAMIILCITGIKSFMEELMLNVGPVDDEEDVCAAFLAAMVAFLAARRSGG